MVHGHQRVAALQTITAQQYTSDRADQLVYRGSYLDNGISDTVAAILAADSCYSGWQRSLQSLWSGRGGRSPWNEVQLSITRTFLKKKTRGTCHDKGSTNEMAGACRMDG